MSKTRILGYWARSSGHEYHRHSVQEIEEFVGWPKLREICEAGGSPRNKALPAALFLTGCRVSEGIQLRRSTFDLADPKRVRCVDVPIVKQKLGKRSRTFSFPRGEPVWPYVEQYLAGLKRPDSMLFPFTRKQAYNIVVEQGKRAGVELWAHWFRSQRASQMGADYELTENDLLEWFKVKDRNWARRYCHKGDAGLWRVIEKKIPDVYA